MGVRAAFIWTELYVAWFEEVHAGDYVLDDQLGEDGG